MAVGYHRKTQVIINRKNIIENIQEHQKRLPKETEIFAVVKANGYGHGAVEVAKTALEAGVTGFCVSMLDEALELRAAGLTQPILILNMVETTDLSLVSEANISITCGNSEWLKEVSNYLEKYPVEKPIMFHLKVDSGMGRIGFFEKESLLTAYQTILNNPSLQLEGIFTHFATADEKSDTYYKHQLALFKELVAILPQKPRYIHSSNSATALWHEAGFGNLVRLGISMYGLNPSGNTLPLPFPLKPALELTSQLIQVKELPKDSGISYGKTYTTEKAEWIGTVPIGYADGWLRKLQGFSLLVEGEFCPIVGRVCMDQLMIRLPKKYPIGTKVTLIGENHGKLITTQQVADYLETIHYEVCCQLSHRLPRIYQ